MSEDDLVPGEEGHDIAWDIPVLTWVPLSGVLIGLMVWRFGFDRVLVSVIPFVVLLAAITIIDLRELRVPNAILKPAAVVALPLLAISATADLAGLSVVRALLGALIMGAAYFVIGLINPAGMGFGDIKLSPLIGAQLALFGWVPFVRGLFLAFLAVGPVAVLLLVSRKAGLRSGLPFAPFMAVGAIAALVLETL